MVLLVAPPAAAAGPALVVRASPVAAAHAEACLPEEGLATALRQRLPALQVIEGQGTRGDDLGVSLARAGRRWRLELRRGPGEVALLRDLDDAPCPHLTRATALIVERYLRELRWPGADPALAAVEAPAPVATAAAPAETRPWLADLTADAALGVLLSPDGATAAGSVELGVRLRSRARLSLRALVGGERASVAEIQEAPRATLASRPYLVLAGLGLCKREGRGGLCAAAEGGAFALAGSGRGQIYRATSGWSAAPALGASARLAVPLSSGFELTAQLGLAIPLATAAVEIEGTPARHAGPRVFATATAGAGWRFF
jgi:hypothetical protein